MPGSDPKRASRLGAWLVQHYRVVIASTGTFSL